MCKKEWESSHIINAMCNRNHEYCASQSMVHLLHVQSKALMDTMYIPYFKFCLAIIIIIQEMCFYLVTFGILQLFCSFQI